MKKFLILGNMNAITYKEVWPYIQSGSVWMGYQPFGSKMFMGADGSLQKFGNVCWFTNLDHNKRHVPLALMSMEDNLRFNKAVAGRGYESYSNYPAIDVPETKAIPADYAGDMGVPISFLGKFCADQFEIVKFRYGNDGKDLRIGEGAGSRTPYFRIVIRHKKYPDSGYERYDNYAAIEVPETKAIPADYPGVMGVPISFLDKYCPEQFEIVGCSYRHGRPAGWDEGTSMSPSVGGQGLYKRIFIRHRNLARTA